MLRRSILWVSVTLIVNCLAVSAQVREKETPQTREQKIRDILEKFNLAYQEKDADSIGNLVAPDLTAFAAGKIFTSWQQYRDDFLNPAFSRSMPPSTWEVEKVVTTPEMAWAYTKTSFSGRRQGQQVEADLYEVFILQKPQVGAKSSGTSVPSDWKIAAIDYTFHRESPSVRMMPDTPRGAQPK